MLCSYTIWILTPLGIAGVLLRKEEGIPNQVMLMLDKARYPTEVIFIVHIKMQCLSRVLDNAHSEEMCLL